MNTSSIDTKRIALFLALAFGIAWLIALVIFLTGGLANSPVLIPGTPFTLALVLLAAIYMFAPAIANLLTRLLTKEGWNDAWLRPHFRRGWRFWLLAWLLPPLLISLGAAVFYLLFPQYLDTQLTVVSGMLAASPQTAGINPWLIIVSQVMTGLLLPPIANSLFTFGEEFGWRGYLLQKLLPLGTRRAVILSGVIWGLWHAPIIAMGHNYGLDYPGVPWSGIAMMTVFTVGVGTFLAWATLRAGSIWPAVIGHAMINGFAGITLLFTIGTPNPLLGPATVGVIGGLPWLILAALLLRSPRAFGLPQAAITESPILE